MSATAPTPPTDFYVSYSAGDGVHAGRLRHVLEQLGFTVALREAAADRAPRERLELNERLLGGAKNLIALYSRSYAADAEARNELLASFSRTKQGHDHDYLVIALDTDLPILFQASTYIDLRQVPEDRHAEQIRLQLEKRKGNRPRDVSPAVVSVERLASPKTAVLGRDGEVAAMRSRWNDPGVRVFEVHGSRGGEGKTAFVHKFLEALKEDHYPQVDRVVAYSFAGQGSGATPDGVATSTEMFELLQEWFGIKVAGLNDLDKGKEAARLLAAQKALVILDGIEPLVSGLRPNRTDLKPGDSAEFRVGDMALLAFLSEFVTLEVARVRLLITTRVSLQSILRRGLEGSRSGHSRDRIMQTLASRFSRVDLKPLAAEAAAGVLHNLGLRGTRDDLKDAAQTYCRNHPLTLTLFARYIADKFGGDLSRKSEFSHLIVDETEGRSHFPVLSSLYDILTPQERGAMKVVALFDRPVARDVLAATFFGPRGASLFSQIAGPGGKPVVGPEPFAALLAGLKQKSLIDLVDHSGKEHVDTHPLIRNYCVTRFERETPDLYKRAHRAVYFHLTRSVKTFRPTTKEELLVLYRAVRHGALGELGAKAGWMYGIRCLRGFGCYSTNFHGMIRDDLELISHYFEGKWERLRPDRTLSGLERCHAYRWAGALLINQGRGAEAEKLMRAALKECSKVGDNMSASRTARHLATMFEMNGELDKAHGLVSEAVGFADSGRFGRGGLFRALARVVVEPYSILPLLESRVLQQVTSRVHLASVLRHQGKLAEAKEVMAEAQRLQAKKHPDCPTLKGFWGFRHGQLLISRGEYDEAIRHARLAQIDPQKPKGWVEGVHGKPLNQVIEAHARVRRFLAGGEEGHDEAAEVLKLLSQAIDGDGQSGGLRNSFQYWLLIPALLVRAEAQRVFGEDAARKATLEYAQELAGVLDLKTYQMELQFEEALGLEARGDHGGARELLEKLLPKAEEAGYLLLHREAAELRARL